MPRLSNVRLNARRLEATRQSFDSFLLPASSMLPARRKKLHQARFVQPKVKAQFSADPLYALPVELQAHCFSMLDLDELIIASHVCRRWRAVALGHPALWRYFGTYDPRSIEILSLVVERSRSAKLHLDCSRFPTTPIVQLLLNHVHRVANLTCESVVFECLVRIVPLHIRRLSLDDPFIASQLRTLGNFPGPCNATFPRLKALTFSVLTFKAIDIRDLFTVAPKLDDLTIHGLSSSCLLPDKLPSRLRRLAVTAPSDGKGFEQHMRQWDSHVPRQSLTFGNTCNIRGAVDYFVQSIGTDNDWKFDGMDDVWQIRLAFSSSSGRGAEVRVEMVSCCVDSLPELLRDAEPAFTRLAHLTLPATWLYLYAVRLNLPGLHHLAITFGGEWGADPCEVFQGLLSQVLGLEEPPLCAPGLTELHIKFLDPGVANEVLVPDALKKLRRVVKFADEPLNMMMVTSPGVDELIRIDWTAAAGLAHGVRLIDSELDVEHVIDVL